MKAWRIATHAEMEWPTVALLAACYLAGALPALL